MVPPTEHTDDLSSKFEDFEYRPKPQVWEQLETAAGEQGVGVLGTQFEGFQHVPDTKVWKRIEADLHPGKRRRTAVLWWALAAGIAFLLVWTGWQNDWLRPEPSPAQVAMEKPVQAEPLPAMVPEIECPESEAQSYTAENQRAVPLNKSEVIGEEPIEAVDLPAPGVTEENGGSSIWHRNRGQEGNFLAANVSPPRARTRRYRTAIKVNQAEVAIIGRPMLLERFEADSLAKEKIEVGPKSERKALMAGLGTNYSPLVASNGIGSAMSHDYVEPSTAFGPNASIEQNLDSRGYRENFSTPIIFNASVQKHLSKHWAAVGGLVYTQLRSNYTRKSGDWEFESSTRRQYLGISIAPRYHFLNRKHYSVYATLGGQYDLGLGRKYRKQDLENGSVVSNVTSRTAIGNQALTKMGLGMDAALTKRLNLNFQLSVLTYIYQSHYNLWSERVNWPAAQIGLNLEI